MVREGFRPFIARFRPFQGHAGKMCYKLKLPNRKRSSETSAFVVRGSSNRLFLPQPPQIPPRHKNSLGQDSSPLTSESDHLLTPTCDLILSATKSETKHFETSFSFCRKSDQLEVCSFSHLFDQKRGYHPGWLQVFVTTSSYKAGSFDQRLNQQKRLKKSSLNPIPREGRVLKRGLSSKTLSNPRSCFVQTKMASGRHNNENGVIVVVLLTVLPHPTFELHQT